MTERSKSGDRPDNWWWLVVKTPSSGVHLYELGYAAEDGTVLDEDRYAEIREELGAPMTNIWEHPEWVFEMAPGRPNAYLRPKAYDEGHHGEPVLLPIRARDGVTLHLFDAAA